MSITPLSIPVGSSSSSSSSSSLPISSSSSSSSSSSNSASSSASSSTSSTSSNLQAPSSHIQLKIQNMVSSCRVTEQGTTVDLKKLVIKARNAEYNPKRFAAVIMRLREPKSTALIFRSGKMVILGTKQENEARIAARKFAAIMNKCDVVQAQGAVGKITFRDFKVSNIVAVANCNFPIRLEGLALSHMKFSSYEPELFPGLIYRLQNPKLVLLIFVSGKVVLTGAKSKQALREGFDKMYYFLHEHRKVYLSTAPAPNPVVMDSTAILNENLQSSSSSSSMSSSAATTDGNSTAQPLLPLANAPASSTS